MIASKQRMIVSPCTLILYPCLVILAGCLGQVRHPKPNENSASTQIKAANLHPGMCCRIEMVLPPTATSESYQRYVGKITEVTSQEVILEQASEEDRIEYESSSHNRPPSTQDRGTVRVPLAGVATIKVIDSLPPPAAKADAGSKTTINTSKS